MLDRWFGAISSWTDVTVEYAFVYTPSEDETLQWLQEFGAHIYEWTDGVHGKDRDWTNPERIQTLANMRNHLLDKVSEMEFDYYFSLDSDIVVTDVTLNDLRRDPWRYGAFGPTVRLAKDRSIINAFTRRPDGFYRRAKPGYHGMVDVLCAAKLMIPHLVRDQRVRYDYHPLGEDFAWSQRAKENGYDLALCNSMAEHFMDKPVWTQLSS